METEGVNAVSPDFGPYQFAEILDYYANNGYNVIGEIRGTTPDPEQYADHIIGTVNYLYSQGVPSNQIAIMGFSKGAAITIVISTKMEDPQMSYILIGICGEWLDQEPNLELTGRVLSLYEESDSYGSSCQGLADRSISLTSFKEIKFRTGKGHGAFYQADPAWMDPVIAWLRSQD